MKRNYVLECEDIVLLCGKFWPGGNALSLGLAGTTLNASGLNSHKFILLPWRTLVSRRHVLNFASAVGYCGRVV